MSTQRLPATGEKTAVRHHTSKAKYKASGFTLIEVMIALAIFVIGALAIVRIFPPALNVIQGSESRSIAMNRARAFLARSTAQPGLVPDSIYDFIPTSANFAWRNDDVSVTGTTIRNRSLPTGLDEGSIGNSALGRFKRIVGEKHRVLRFGGTSTTPPTRFVLSQFAHAADQARPSAVSVFVEDQISGVTVRNNGELDFTDARLGIDGRAFNERDYTVNGASRPPLDPATTPPETIAPREWRRVSLASDTPPNAPETIYYVTYRYVNDTDNDNVIDVGERVQGIVDEPLILPDPTGEPTGTDARVMAARTPTNRIIIAGEVGVRVKRLLRPAIIEGTQQESERDSIRGYVEIADENADNLIPADLRVPGDDNSFIYPTVSLNYTVRDWRWLIDDDTPQRVTGEVTTPIRFYDSERLFDPALGLAVENTSKPVIATLLETDSNGNTNRRFGWWDQQAGVDTTANTALTAVDRKTGVINYSESTVTPAPVPRARTSYWTLDGWAQQISVAARSYVPFYTTTVTGRLPVEREEWREYYWAGPGNGRLYFPPGEAGKSVLVTFEYEDSSTNTYKTQTRLLTIEDRADAGLTGVPVTAFGSGARKAEFFDAATNTLYDVRAILSVRGLSIQSRTAWIENNARYTHAEAVGYRKLD
jgi:prepilin-type N-terminal cleavage/methylation domain-containing protein